MTPAEQEIVADAGRRIKAICAELTIPASAIIDDLRPGPLVHTMDGCALELTSIYAALGTLPLVEA